MSELVIAINREQLFTQGIHDSGLCRFDLSQINQSDYALLPREFADNKSSKSLVLGNIFAQILSYVVVKNHEDKILTYQRKGKEKGLLGKWSIGVGGHISHEDFLALFNETHDYYPTLANLISIGTERELQEELGKDPNWFTPMFNSVDDFVEGIKFCIASYDDPTSSVHVGLPFILDIGDNDLELEESEFLNYQWLHPEALAIEHTNKLREFETWSRILIENFDRLKRGE